MQGARVLESARSPERDAVGLTRSENDRAELVNDLVVVREHEGVADADREVDGVGSTVNGAPAFARAAGRG